VVAAGHRLDLEESSLRSLWKEKPAKETPKCTLWKHQLSTGGIHVNSRISVYLWLHTGRTLDINVVRERERENGRERERCPLSISTPTAQILASKYHSPI
jgi:hypothetical protein